MNDLKNDIIEKCRKRQTMHYFNEKEIEAIDLAYNEQQLSPSKLSKYFKCRDQRMLDIIEMLKDKIDYKDIVEVINNGVV